MLSEIWSTVKQNKMRALLTGFAISWGVFILVVLLSASNGLKNGVTANFENESVNTLVVISGWTSMEYKGYAKWREIVMDNSDSVMFANAFNEIEQVYPSQQFWNQNVTYGDRATTVNLGAVYPQAQDFEGIKITSGRFLNVMDIREKRKVVVIDEKAAKVLFDEAECIGKHINIDNLVYTVVGVAKSGNSWRSTSYIPYTVASITYNQEGQIYRFNMLVQNLPTVEENEALTKAVRTRMSIKHEFHPDDYNALHIGNGQGNFFHLAKVFRGLNIFFWIIGIGTLMGGIVGVSNIMLITVRERTREFGIRKTVGATPFSVLRLVLLESVMITSFFGYIGIVIGMIYAEIIGLVVSKLGEQAEGIFKNPSVDLRIVVGATIMLIVAGTLAGYFPAKKAVMIKPIEALRYE